jgi:hypothetical protein
MWVLRIDRPVPTSCDCFVDLLSSIKRQRVIDLNVAYKVLKKVEQHYLDYNKILDIFVKILLSHLFLIFLILICEAICIAATPGLFCQPRVIVKMIVEK